MSTKDRTTLGYETLLKEWKHFQLQKLKVNMEHTYPCIFICVDPGGAVYDTNMRGTLSMLRKPGREKEELYDMTRNINLTVPLANIREYNTGMKTEALCSVALADLEDFVGEMVSEPTQPSSNESDQFYSM